MIQDSDRLTVPMIDRDQYLSVLEGMGQWWNAGPGGRSGGVWFRRNVRGLYGKVRRPRGSERFVEMAVTN